MASGEATREGTTTDSARGTDVDVSIDSGDGFRLAGTLFEPAATDLEVVVLVSAAVGIPRRYYRRFAGFLASQGFTVLTYDYREIGDSVDPGWRGRRASVRVWGELDVAAAIDWLRGRFPDRRLLCVGHCIGGVLLGLAANHHHVFAHVTLASHAWYWKNWLGTPVTCWGRIWLFAHVAFPLCARLFGYFPGARLGSADWPKGVALEWARWARSRRFAIDDHGRPLPHFYRGFSGPMRLYGFTDDLRSGPPGAVAGLTRFVPHIECEVIYRSPEEYGMAAIGHIGFFRSSTPQRAWQEIADWLRARVQA